MGFLRNSTIRTGRGSDITAPAPWRHTGTPSVGSIPSVMAPSTESAKCSLKLIQLLIIILLFGYICLPSHFVRTVSSNASVLDVSHTGRKMLGKVAEVASSFSGRPENFAGVAIVAACMNRQEALKRVLPTWLSVSGVKEIVVVDWNSSPPLKSLVHPEKDSRLKLYRVNKENSWVLSRAYNLAMNMTRQKYVIRTDCDYALDADILSVHDLNETETGFYSGNWKMARNENEIHLNGAMILKRKVFWDVGGYDERIQTYGWDDEDLYTRLAAHNIQKLNVSYDHVNHISHGDGKRAQKGVKYAQVQIDLNQLLLERLPPWSKNDSEGFGSSQYQVLDRDGKGYFELEAEHVPKSLRRQVEDDVYEDSWALALGRRLADDFHVPWDILESTDSENKELLLRKLLHLQNDLDFQRKSVKAADNGTEDISRLPAEARILFVHCMHGLGNRLRALGSALAFARTSHRVPVVIWESDAHIAADFNALFNTSGMVVLKKFIPTWPLHGHHKYDHSWNHFLFYNYMEMEPKAVKGELIVNEKSKHIYYKGAYILEAPEYTWWDADNEELRKLQPVQMVTERLQELKDEGLSSAVGVHIRNRTLTFDIKNVDFNQEYGSDAAATMEHWRSQSSYRNFVSEMKRIIREEDKDTQFYIATDTWEVIPRMEALFPGRILSTNRTCDDRDSECVKYAVIDMYALSGTRKLLGSNWSSYTEMAERLGGLKAKLAGLDFGEGAGKLLNGEAGEHEEVEKSEEEVSAELEDRQFDTGRE